jgi:hypothetical protein
VGARFDYFKENIEKLMLRFPARAKRKEVEE